MPAVAESPLARSLTWGDLIVREVIPQSRYEVIRPEMTPDIFVRMMTLNARFREMGFRTIGDAGKLDDGRILTVFYK